MDEAMQIMNNIAGQLHHMKPDAWVPGVDIGMETIKNDDEGYAPLSLVVRVKPLNRTVIIAYHVCDTYTTTVFDKDTPPAGDCNDHVFVDDLGEIVFGGEAKPFTLPHVAITTWDEDGNETTETF